MRRAVVWSRVDITCGPMRVVGCGERAECGGTTRDWRRPLRAGEGLPNGSPRQSVMFKDD
jgi:hypothetical protein